MGTTVFGAAQKELFAAERAISDMRAAKTFADFEESWRRFLNATEKCWTKIENAGKSLASDFQPWLGQYITLRREDELLRYLKHARNADQHTIQEVVEHRPGRYEFTIPGGPGVVHIQSLRTGADGRIIEYRGSHAPKIIDEPPRLELLRVKDRGKWYTPPSNHRGVRLKNATPLGVAETALAFYKELTESAEKRFPRDAA
jgi:hypothetical protein